MLSDPHKLFKLICCDLQIMNSMSFFKVFILFLGSTRTEFNS